MFGRPCCSHDTNLVGNIKGILLLGESNVGLLLSLWSDEGVNLVDLDLVKFGAASSDHFLVSFSVNHEDEGVAVFNVLNGTLGTEWVLDDGELVEGLGLLNCLKDVLWRSLLSKSLWHSEGGFVPNLSFSCGMSTLFNSGSGCLCGLNYKQIDC